MKSSLMNFWVQNKVSQGSKNCLKKELAKGQKAERESLKRISVQ